MVLKPSFAGDGDVPLRELIHMMRKSYDAVKDMRVQFSAERLDDAPNSVVEKFNVDFICRGEDLFAKVCFFSRDLNPPDWFAEESLWLKGVQVRHPRLKGAHVVISDNALNPDFGINWYANSIFRAYMVEQVAEIGSTDYWLPQAIENNQEQYRVEGAEIVEGISCVRVSRETLDRRDIIWVAPEMGCCVVRRELYWGEDNREECIALDFFEPIVGVWLPQRVERRIIGRPYWAANQWDANSTGSRLTLRVTTLTVNRVKDDDFVMQFPVGTHIFDTVRKLHYPITTDATFDFQRGLDLAFGNNISQPRVSRRLRWLLIANLVAVVLIVFCLLWKRLTGAGRVPGL
jgi:hypothetical protein